MADGGIGETALLSEIAPEIVGGATDFLAPAAAELGGLGGLLGGGVSAAGTGLGAGGIGGGLGSIAASAAPEAMSQITAAQQAAQVGSNQMLANAGSAYTHDALTQAALQSPNPAAYTMQQDALVKAASAYTDPALQTVGSTTASNLGPQATQDALQQAASQYPTPNYPAAPTSPFGGLGDMAKQAMDWYNSLKPAEKMLYGGAAGLAAPTIMSMFKKKQGLPAMAPYSGPLSKFHYDPSQYTPNIPAQPTPYTPQYRSYAGGGPVEMMANANAIGQNTGYPMANIHQGAYATPYQTPISENVLSGASDTNVDPYTGEEKFASGGIASLGAYSDGGQMLKGPGDGMSDNIPATIAGKQPARLANDEFVVPADVVSHLGNGSSDAGAKQLYKMMDRVRQARTGKKAQGTEIKPDKYMPA
jgi:hypothetical protein